MCTAAGRDDCYGRPPTGCPATALEYVNNFSSFRATLKQQEDSVGKWTEFRKKMEAIQNRSSIELCRSNLNDMKRVESEIPPTQACPGEADAVSRSSDGGKEDNIAKLTNFRDCSETKAKQLTEAIKQRKALRVGEETSQLHSLIKDVTKVHTDSIELLIQFREQADEARQVKCWLRGRIRDCGR